MSAPLGAGPEVVHRRSLWATGVGDGADWDQTLSCDGCHGGAADVDNWDINDGTLAKIDTGSEWLTFGHGGVGMAGDACLYCHDTALNFGADHYDDANPFRLVNNNATGDGWNSNCLVCHKAGSAGYNGENGVTKADASHAGSKHGDDNDGATRIRASALS